jgi:DNA modification methylase
VNTLWYGDNLTIMQEKMGKHSVDLIYLDPPFNSKQNYNLLYKTLTGKPVPEQVEAFCDTWEMDPQKEAIARSMPVLMREHGVDDYYVDFWRLWMQALRHSQPHLLAYLIFMVQRLLYMKTVLRPTGSIYLHCDSTASDHYTFNQPYSDYDPAYLESMYRFTDEDGRRYRLISMIGPGGAAKGNPFYEVMGVSRHWRYSRKKMQELIESGMVVQTNPGTVPQRKQYLDQGKGVPVQSLWDDVAGLHAGSKERLGYPTQKPIDLVKRIIEASSNPGDIVFDPFCGCGTSIYAAHETGRNWIGCDIAILSIKLVREILASRYRLVEGHDFTVAGIPTSVEGAQELFNKDPSTFQKWFVERVGGFPMNRHSGDRGIDGRIYFETSDGLKEMLIQVKGGKHVRPTDVRDLRGTLEREGNAELAGFLSMAPPSKAMLQEAAEAGTYEYFGVQYPRIQFLTAHEVLEGKREFAMPTRVGTKIHTGQHSLAL